MSYQSEAMLAVRVVRALEKADPAALGSHCAAQDVKVRGVIAARHNPQENPEILAKTADYILSLARKNQEKETLASRAEARAARERDKARKNMEACSLVRAEMQKLQEQLEQYQEQARTHNAKADEAMNEAHSHRARAIDFDQWLKGLCALADGKRHRARASMRELLEAK